MSYDIEAELGIGVSLRGSEAEPLHGFGQVFGYAIASGVYVTEVQLGINIPLLGEAAHAIRSFPLVSQRPISVSIQLALVVPFQDKTGSGIGFAAGPGRGLDEDDGCALGRVCDGWNTCGTTLLSPPLRSLWRGDNLIRHG